MPQAELWKLKTAFLEYLEVEKNRSPLTIRNYDHYLTRFTDFAKRQGIRAPERLSLDLVRKFRLHLNRLPRSSALGRGQPQLKLASQNYHLVALRSFLKYLARRDIRCLAAEKIELPHLPSRQVMFLESHDLEKLLDAPCQAPLHGAGAGQEKDELLRARDKAILELLFSTGLRVQELASLKREQINLEKQEFAVKGKGGKIRAVFLSGQAQKALAAYLKSRSDNSPAMFIRHNREEPKILKQEPLSPRTIQRLVKKYALLAGVSLEITPHTLRHTMATDLLAGGADLRSVQEILGHSSITTTQIYTHVTNKRLREVHKKYHGRFRKIDN